jgi:gliding motility-associated-like protein
MKKILLLITLALHTINVFSQGSNCASATPFCTSVGTPFTYNNVTDGGTGASCVSTTCPGVGCLGSTPRPSWFYLKSTAAGVMTFSLTQSSTSPGGTPNIDVDFIAYGPYTAAGFATACTSGLTGTCTANHACTGNMEDCSYSAASTETMTLTATAPGQYFLVMITNFNGTAGWITFTQTGGPGSDCSITCPSVTAGDGLTLSSGQPLPATLTCDAGTIPLYASDISPFGAPIVPGVMFNFTTNNNTSNDINVYQSGFGYIGSLGPLTTGTNYDYQVYFLNPTSTYTFELCENNTAQPNMAYSIVDLASGNTINFGTWVDDGACQQIVIPAGTITGSASFSASCGACVTTVPNGTGSFNPSTAGAGTHTVTYTFAPGGACPTYTFSKVFTVLSPTVNTAMTSTTICEGASATLTLSGGYSQTFSNNSALTITDGSTVGVSSPITVTGIPGNAGSNLASLTINVTHTYDSDLDLFLVCPGGYTIALSRANGGSGDNYTATTFSTSGTSIYAGAPPFTGTFRPEDPLWALSGCTSNGTWRLFARDAATPDQGTITSWSMTFTDKNTYSWTPNTNLSATTGTNVVASPTTTTVYSVTASSNAGCVGAVKTITVNVNPKPTPSITSAPTSSVCLGSAISFTAGTANTYTWSTGGTGGLSGTSGANVNATPTATGNISYTVNMTSAAGCTNTATKIMTVNPVPLANAGSPATITCTSPTVTLTGSGGGSYAWTGPSITSGSNTATPSVTGAGTYSLAVTSAAGCTSTLSTVAVAQNTTAPAVTPSVSAVLNCTLTSVNVSASTGASPVSYNWSGTGITSATNISTITVNQPGTFNYTVTNTSNGCTTTGSQVVTQNNAAPAVTPSVSAVLNCTLTSVNVSASTAASPVTYNWSGTGITSATNISTITVNQPGTFNYTVTNTSNGCTTTGSQAVTQNTAAPAVTPSVSAVLNCTLTSVNVSASTAASPVSYNWSGTGITSATNISTITVNQPGTFNYTVTNTSNGCKTTGSQAVTQNTTPPAVTSSVSAVLNCTLTSVNVSASTAASPVSYNWSGTGITSATNISTITVNQPGTFNYTVTNTSNGCTTTGSQAVTQNTTAPAVTPSVSAVLNCTLTSVNVSASTAASPVSYNWSGTGITSATNISTITVNQPGTFNYTVTNTSNGCTTTGSQAVTQNITAPVASSTVSGVLNCTLTSVNVSATTAATPVTYNWSGTGITSATNISTITVNQPGTFNYTITNTSNGCSTTGSQAVTQSTTALVVTPAVSGVLNCTLTSVNVSATTASSPVTYNWTGTGITSATNISTITVNQPGTFNYTVTNTSNGCQATGSQAVTQNTTAPAVTSNTSGVLNCTLTSVNVGANTAASPVSYNWTGTGITSATNISTITVNQPGTFNYTVTNTSNGCTTTGSQAVTQNTTAPATTSSVSAVLNCTLTSVNVSASTAASPVSYNWNGTGITSATNISTITVNQPGTFNYTVTNTSNGCTTTGSQAVTQNITPPAVTSNTSGVLNCTLTSVNVSASTAASPVSYNWTGTGITSATNISTITVNQPGTFNYTVTNTSNGCTSTGSQAVTQNTTAPSVSSSNTGSLSCSVLTSSVNATTTTTPVSYNWSGTGITSATNISTITVNQGGTFNYTVTNTSNGCTTTGSQAVVQNTTAPVTVASTTGSITCVTNTVNLNSSLAGMSYTWTAPAGSSIAGGTNLQNAVGQGTGTYTLSVINPANDCTYTTSIAAVQNITTPTSVNAGPTQTLICGVATVTLNGSATPGTATANWLGGVASPNSFTTTAGSANVYTLQAINPATGCFITSTVQVLSSVGSPSATANAVTNSITCTNSSVSIGVTLTSAGPVTYQWSTPGISGSTTGSSATATLAGVYTVTITNNPGNNCSVQINISVPSNTTPVVASIAPASTITCNTPSVTLSASPVGSAYTYTWTGVAPVVSGGSSQNPIVDVGGSYSVAITNTVNGCVGTSTVFVPSNTVAPTASVAVSSVTTTCASPTVMLNASASPATNVSYSWTAPATGSLDDNTINNPVASGSGVFTVVVTNTVSGCSTAISQATVNVVADSNIPAVSLSANSLSITCTNPTPSTAITTTSSPVSYSWTPTAGIVPGTETTANPQFSLAGTYSLVVTNTVSGCASSISGNVINVVNDNTIPVISLSAGANSGTLTCLNTSVVVTPTITPASGNLTYTWSPATGMSTPINQASATFTDAGVYTLAVTNTVTGCVSTATGTANSFTVIADNATPGFTLGTTGSVTTTCAAPNATLSASSDADPNSVYTWTSPSSSTVTGNPVVFGTPGIYTVSVTNTLTGCSTASTAAQATVEIVADAGIPSATLTANSLSITCLDPTPTVTVSTTSSPVSYSWSPTSGIVPGTETTANPVFNAAGSYSVVVTNTVSGCASSIASNVVNVSLDNDTPVISLSTGANSGTLTCLITSVSITPTITPASGNLTYTWSPAAGISTPLNQASATFTDAGVYTLAVTNTLTGCVSSATSTANSFTVVANNSTPGFTLGTASSVTTTCAAPSATLSGSSDADPNTVYTWLTPSSTIVTGNPIVVNAAGIYTVSVTNTLTGCTTASTAAQATVEVIVGGGVPNVSLTANSLSITCSNPTPSVVATTTDTPVSYSWAPTSGIVPGTETTDTPVFTAAGSYSLVVTNTISGCATSISSNVVDVVADNATPVITLSATTNTGSITCLNTSVSITPTITPASGNLTYTWSPAAGISTPLNQASATFTDAGVYTLAVTNTLTGCVSSATSTANSYTVTLDNTAPTATITAVSSNTMIGCGASNATVTLGSTVNSTNTANLNWLPSNTSNPTLGVTTAGVYTLEVVDAVNGCSVTTQYTVTGSSTPPQNVDAGAGVSIPCGTNTVVLNGTTTSTNVSYTWTGPSATSIVSGGNTTNPLVDEAGTYTFTVTDNLTGCQTSTAVVVSQASVNISFTADQTSGIAPLNVNFTNTSTGATSYSWNFGDGNTATTQDASNIFTASGSYIVTLTSTSGCPGTYTMEIIVNDGLTLEIPNVFTPNNDNVNDVFTIKSTGVKEISLQIFNRWGEKLYEFSGARASWDGLAPNGMKVPEGTYFYFVKATGFDDKEIEKQGTVNLFR